MKTDPIKEAKEVFHTLERWTAFYEIEQQIDQIIDHWLSIGSKALRQHFTEHPSPGWRCSDWGHTRDTRWYLTGKNSPGENGISIGIGWEGFELHLFHGGCDSGVRERALELLKSPDFEPLRLLAGSPEQRAARRSEGSILSVPDFNPFDEVGDSGLRPRIIAWHAVHRTADFVDRVSRKIRQITEDSVITGLIADLNRQAVTDVPDAPLKP